MPRDDGVIWFAIVQSGEGQEERTGTDRPGHYRPVMIGAGVGVLALLAIGLTVTNSRRLIG